MFTSSIHYYIITGNYIKNRQPMIVFITVILSLDYLTVRQSVEKYKINKSVKRLTRQWVPDGWLLCLWTYIVGFHVWFVGCVCKVKGNVKEVNDFLVCFNGDFKVV